MSFLSPRILLTILLAWMVIEIKAQMPGGGPPQGMSNYALKGKVVDDANGEPLEFATVSLRKMRDSSLVAGTITSKTGDFRIDNLPPGGFTVEIAFIGYGKYTQRAGFRPPDAPPVLDLGTIRLKVSAKMLEGAEVSAEKSFILNNIDKKTYNTDQLAVVKGGNVKNVLENIPSVEIDQDGNVSLRGNENVTILIDGRPSGLTSSGGKSMLESIPASAVENVEVITNPSAKYDPEGISGIINIVTKKNKLQGFTGNVGLNYGFEQRYGGNLSLSYRVGKWNLYTNYALNSDNGFTKGSSYRESYFRLPVSVIDQQENGNNDRFGHNIKAGIDLYLNDHNKFSAGLLYNTGKSNEDNTIDYKYYSMGVAGDSLVQRVTGGSNRNRNTDADFSWKHFFTQKGRILTFQATASFDHGEPSNNYFQTVLNDTVNPDLYEKDRTLNNNTNYNFSADYEHPIGDDRKIEAGYKSTFRDFDADFHFDRLDSLGYENDPSRTNHFIYSDQLQAAYAQFKQAVGKFGYQIGLRSEYATTESNLVTTDSIFHKDYFSIFPSAFLTYKPSLKSSFKATYSRRINRPRRNTLNPFPNYDDPQNVRVGNPALDPEYTDSYELEFMHVFEKFTLTTTGYARVTKDNIQRYRIVDTTNISTTTWANLASAGNYGAEFILNGNPFKWWTLTLSSNIYYNILNATNIQENLNAESFTASGRILSTFKPNKKTDLQITYSYRSRMKVTQGYMKDMQMMSVAASRKLLKDKAVFSVRLSDPFNMQRFGFEFSDPLYMQDFTRKRQSRTLNFSFTYRFGELRDRDQQQRMREQRQQEMDMEG